MVQLRRSLRLCKSSGKRPADDPSSDDTPHVSSVTSGLPCRKKIKTVKESSGEVAPVPSYVSKIDIFRPLGGSRRITEEEKALYSRKLEESEGFDVPRLPGTFFLHKISPVNCRDTDVKESTNFAIEHHNNSQKEEGSDLQLVRVVKANYSGTFSMKYYITFEAKDTEGHVQTYETLVRELPLGTLEKSVLVFRLKQGSGAGATPSG